MNIEPQFRALRRLATRLVHDDAAADDLVQDAWVDALRNPPRDDRPSGPWLRTVLRNRRVSNHRAETRRRGREAATEPASSVPSAEQLQTARELLDHVAALPEPDRDLLTLRYWEGLTLHECAERLELSASTVRTRHARALTKLRKRLDERAGGREAWLAALVPWAQLSPPPSAATTSGGALNFASLSVGGVLAGALLWLTSALDPACTMDATSTTAPDGPTAADADDESAHHRADASPAPSAKRRPFAALPVDPDKHPCDSPIAAEDSPTMAKVWQEGRSPTKDETLASYHECVLRHGSPRDYGAVNEGPDGSVHPLLSATMSLREVWPVMRHCYTGDDPARVRVAFSIWLQSDGEMIVDDVRIVDSERLDDAQLACVVSSMYVAELALRRGDPTQMDLPKGTVLEIPRLIELRLDGELAEVVGGGHRARANLAFEDKAAFEAGLGECTQETVNATLHWDPDSGALLDVGFADATPAAVRTCLGGLLREQVEPQHARFFPRNDADTMQVCTFAPGEKPDCEREPLFHVVEDQ